MENPWCGGIGRPENGERLNNAEIRGKIQLVGDWSLWNTVAA